MSSPSPRLDAPPNTSSVIDKIWSQHLVTELSGGLSLVHIDRVMMHERSGGIALTELANSRRSVAHPELAFATIDHVVETLPGRTAHTRVPGGAQFIGDLRSGVAANGIRIFDLDDPRQGIVHVISPELGVALPGITLVCNDSHTGTVGGVGALAWGIGTTELSNSLASQCLMIEAPLTMRIELSGMAAAGTTAKDVILHLIGVIGADGARGYTVEFAGTMVDRMSIEERLTICNLAVEFAARTAIVAPDARTFEYLAGTEFAPSGAVWEHAVRAWTALRSDPAARYAKRVSIDCSEVIPQITWGTSLAHVMPITGRIPRADEHRQLPAASVERALHYMGLTPGEPILGQPIDVAFIGSCTNSRISDLRAAAKVLRGRTVADGVLAICVPGSQQVKAQAEREGLDKIFKTAGFSWREPGCSMCFYAGGESFAGMRSVTTTNRNFENRQGPGTRSHLASPATVAASAIAGAIADPRIV